MRPFVTYRGLICQWINITRRVTVRRCIEQVWEITDYILFIIFSTWFYQLWFYQYFISSLSNLNFCHLFLPVFQPSIKTSPPQQTLFDLPYQQQTMGAVSLVDQDTWVFYISVIAMNDYVSNFPSQQKFPHCSCKISTLVLQNSPPIPHYRWRQKKPILK